jgi:hypothetical protein
MAQTIKLKRSANATLSSGQGIPTTSQLALGEVAINTHHGKVYIKKDDGSESIVEIGGGNLPLTGGTLTGNTVITSSGTIGLGTVGNGYLQITNGTDTLAFDPNEIYGTLDLNIGTASGDIDLRPSTGVIHVYDGTNEATLSYTKIGQWDSAYSSLANYLPLTGGSLSGALTVAGLLSVTNNPIKITASAPELIFSVPSGGLDSRIHNDGSGNFIFGTGANSNTPTERMRITAAGNVGIGTTAPAFRLHTYHPTTNVVARFESGDAEVWLDLHDSNSGSYGALLGHDGAAGDLFKVANASVDTKFVIKNDGNVGIGTTAPTEKLHIHNGGIYSTPVTYAANQDDWALKIGASNNAGWDFAGIKLRVDSVGVPRMSLMGAGQVEAVSIVSSRVGIGTNAPVKELHVDGTFVTEGGARSNPTGINNAVVIDYQQSAGNTGRLRSRDWAGATWRDFAIEAANINLMASGNVGIGTTAPAAKLHLKKASAGTTHVDGYATAIIEDTEARLQLISDDGGNNASAVLLSNETKHWGMHHKGPSSSNSFSIGYVATTGSGTDIVNAFSEKFSITTAGAITFNQAFTLPTADGSANQVLQTDGSGNVSWSSVSASTTYSAGAGLVLTGTTFKANLISDTAQTVAANSATTTTSRTYAIQQDADGDLVVNVPWSDTNTVYTLPLATNTVRGGIELFSNTDQTVAANAVTTTTGRTYGVQLNSDNQAVVNVPWSDTDTVYTLPLATNTVRGGIELFSNTDQTVAANAVTTTTGRTYGVQLNSDNQAVVNVPWSDTDTVYTLPLATNTVRGGIELFSNTDQTVAANAVTTTTGRTYGVQLNSDNQAVVNVPWSDTNTDTDTTYSAGTGISLSGTTFSLTDTNAKLNLSGGTLTGNLLIDSASAEINLKSGVGTESGAINWTFNTASTDYASIKLPYGTRATKGLWIDSGYPITVDATTRIDFDISGSTKMVMDTGGLSVTGKLAVGDASTLTSTSETFSTTSASVIASFSASTYGAAKVIVTVKDGSNRHICEMLVTHNGTTAIATQYGSIYTSSELATFEVDISGGNVRILATASSSNSTVYRVAQTLMEA